MSDELAEFRTHVNRGGARSYFQDALKKMDDDERQKVEAALGDRSITAGAIAEVVRGWGYEDVTEHSVATYRRRHR